MRLNNPLHISFMKKAFNFYFEQFICDYEIYVLKLYFILFIENCRKANKIASKKF